MANRKSKASATPPEARKGAQFVLAWGDYVPIGGVDSPLPCPFCGSSENVEINRGQEPHNATVYAVCDACGAQGPWVREDGQTVARMPDLVAAAAREWNKRGRL